MSVVAVKIYKSKIVIGADSFVGFGYAHQRKDIDVKIFKQNGLVVGAVGYAHSVSLFKLYCRDRKPARNDEDAIIDYVTDFIAWASKKINDYKHDTDFMIVYKGHVWYVSAEFYINEVKTYRAMGAGQVAAQAALYLGKGVREALYVATELSIYCEKPINVIEVSK